MGQLRVDKVQEFIKQEISSIILSDLKDPRIGFVTVTQVEVTGDIRNAKIYVSLMGSDQQKIDTWQGLQSALGYMRTEVAKRIRLRYIPNLTLQLDASLDYSAKIQELLLKIKKEEE